MNETNGKLDEKQALAMKKHMATLARRRKIIEGMERTDETVYARNGQEIIRVIDTGDILINGKNYTRIQAAILIHALLNVFISSNLIDELEAASISDDLLDMVAEEEEKELAKGQIPF